MRFGPPKQRQELRGRSDSLFTRWDPDFVYFQQKAACVMCVVNVNITAETVHP